MNDESPVDHQEIVAPIEQIMDEAQSSVESHENAQDNIDHEARAYEKTMVPLSALQKLREKKRELELELQWERQRYAAQSQQKPEEEDNSRYESATREDLRNTVRQSQEEAIRAIEERLWIKQNPEKYEKVNEYLPQFLKQRPNLASAINLASNRYEEAFILMQALSPKQQQQLQKQATQVKKEAPNSPGSIPKAAALNDAVDVMNMSDSEFYAWRQSKRGRR
jgi:hypothetical protein